MLEQLLKLPHIQRETYLFNVDNDCTWFTQILHEIPEKGLALFKMSLIDYSTTLDAYLTPLFQNAELQLSEDNLHIGSDYLNFRKEEDHSLLVKDVENLREFTSFKLSLMKLYNETTLPEDIRKKLYSPGS